MTNTVLSSVLRARLDRELAPSEKVIWLATPRAPRWAPAAVAATAIGLFMAVCGGLTGFMAHVAPPPKEILPAIITMCLAMVGTGLGILLGARAARRWTLETVYAITDRRAIILEPARLGVPATTRSLGAAALSKLARRERTDGSGDLIFDEPFGPRGGTRHGFMMIADVKRVEDTLRATLLA